MRPEIMAGPIERARKALKVRSLIGSWLAPPPRPRPPCAGVSWAKAQSEKHNRSGSVFMRGSISHATEHRAEKRGAGRFSPLSLCRLDIVPYGCRRARGELLTRPLA